MPGYPDLDYQLNFFNPFPEHQLSRYQPEELFDTNLTAYQPMGWGAYVLESWEPGKEIRLRKDPLLFWSVEGLPRFDKLTFRYVGQGLSGNLECLYNGKCDLFDLEASIYLEEHARRLT